MNHPCEEDLVLYYYGEAAEVGAHIEACEACRASYQALQRVLNSVDSLPVPERDGDYEGRVWSSIQGGVAGGRVAKGPRTVWSWKPALALAAMVVLTVSAFFAGHAWRKPARIVAEQGVRERVLLVAVGDHLERSQTVLAELVNAPNGNLDISYERATAEDLLESNRLYRQTASASGDLATESLLDELEPVLLEIAHSPQEVTAQQLDQLRAQIEQKGILFKVKVFGSRMAQANL